MKISQMYVNLPVKDIGKTKKFWTALGFSAHEAISDERAFCMVVKEDMMYVMFIEEEYFRTFSEKPLPENGTTQVLLALALNSREEVDRLVNNAVAHGATQHEEPQDYGWMYHNSFWDINGHGWNITFTDPARLPAGS